MKKELKAELDELLANYPKLKGRVLTFSDEDGWNLSPKNREVTNPEVSICHQTAERPDRLFGISSKIEIRKSPLHGYGIFAKEAIEADEMIEETFLLKMDQRSKYSTDASLKDYVWANQNCNCIECRNHGAFVYLPLGFGSQYNHQDEPHTRQELNFASQVFRLWARVRIEKDEEIFVTYGDKYFLIRNFWKKINETKAFEKAIKLKNQRAANTGDTGKEQ